jgi:ABC-type branched-subunit amino acid transport system ATPase component
VSSAAPPSEDILVVSGLVKHFGGVRAVDGCDLRVPASSLVGLIGPNGAGKSTVLELVSGSQKPDRGTIVFAGEQIQGRPPNEVFDRGIARCFQIAREWPRLTVLENLLIASRSGGPDTIGFALWGRRRARALEREQRERALETLEKYRLYALRNDFAYTLSGGQKRLLEFARIAMAGPRLALLDEPMAGVNPVLQAEIERGIGELMDSGAAVLLIEHNLAFVERLCHEVVVMAQGKVLAGGLMKDLRDNELVQEAYLGSVPGAG